MYYTTPTRSPMHQKLGYAYHATSAYTCTHCIAKLVFTASTCSIDLVTTQWYVVPIPAAIVALLACTPRHVKGGCPDLISMQNMR